MQRYRMAGSTFRLLTGLMGFGALSIVGTVGTDDALAGPIKAGIILAGLAGIGAVLAWARVAATITGPDGVTVRGLLRARTFPWADIQAIQIEANPGGYTNDRAPKQIAVLYDKTGRRVPLPHVHEKNVALATEIEHIQAAWEDRRGPEWAPIASVQRTVDERVRYTFTPWAVGMFAAMLAVPVVAVLFVVGLFTHAYDLPAPLSWPFRPASMLVVPAIVFPAGAVASMVARRRANRPRSA